MENVLVAFIVIFVIVFAALTFSEAMITGQDTLQVNMREVEERLSDQARTSLLPVDEPVFTSATSVTFTYRNTGSTRLADFDQWDVIVQYVDSADPAAYHVDWLDYTDDVPFDDEWSVEGIYLNADEEQAETIEPGILNPGEEIVLLLDIAPQVGPGETIQTVISTQNGISASSMHVRNIPPVLINNLGLTVTHGEVGLIDNTLLLTTDEDNEAQDLVYSVLVAPFEGLLSVTDTFTQTDIDNGLLTYTGDVSGDYTFEFTVSDGKDTIGSYLFTITVVNAEPVLAANTGLTLSAGGNATITSAMLEATDADDPNTALTFTVTSPPTQGSLMPGVVFTQEHINNGLLNYTHTGAGGDSFEFSISDGENVMGPFTFNVTVE